jgi:hypothetical protein
VAWGRGQGRMQAEGVECKRASGGSGKSESLVTS